MPAQAQEDAVDEEMIEEVTVTGSRIARDEFSTTTPIQILNTEAAQRIGIVSVSELLQKSTASSGQQIDGSISTNAGQTNASEAPADGGVGSSCINLRGLGCERTLVLVNGKRLGLSGIRGAPPQPDINMIPIGMVEGVDLLTGGLSTVYGADAVAGVVNVRMKKDFEGINFTMNTEIPNDTGGEIYQASLVGGVGSDTGNITFGMEYSRQERVRTGDRSYSSCLRRGTSGISQTMSGQQILNCRSDFPDNWMTTLGFDAFAAGPAGELVADDGMIPSSVDGTRLIYTPGSSNITYGATGLNPGQPVTGFSLFSALPQTTSPTLATFPHDGVDDTNSRGFALDRFRYDPSTNDQLDRADADLWRPYERFSLVMNGHLDLDWGNNEEAYFEGYYFNRTNRVIGAREQIFPGVPGVIPLVDDTNNPILDGNGALQMVDNPMNPFSFAVSPVLTMDDIPQIFDVELQQIRLVAGITGDMPWSDRWSYDISGSYDRSTGFASQEVLLENHLFNATQNLGAVADAVTGLPNGDVVCDPRFLAPGGLITPTSCVPFDIFNMSVAGDGVTSSGRFSTAAERDYLMGNRTNRTVTEMSVFQAFVTGDLFDLAWNGETVGTAFGIEAREDKIDSQNDAIGVLGLNAAENPLQEGETRGSRTTFDVYGEISAPLIVDANWADLVQVDAAVRFTDDENFGNETVYKIGGLWRINEYAAFSTSFNTSFRAPNLREQFLADQAGALPGGSDPCHNNNISQAPPSMALDRLIANCVLSGADWTQLGTAFTVAIPTSVGGAAGLNPETSESLTATLTLAQPWTDRFDFDLALTYFDITIEDTVRALDPGTIVARCYNDQPNLASPFCDRVSRNRANATPLNNFIGFVRAGFVNTGEETANGFDITTRFNMEFDRVNLNWSTATTFMDERLSQEFPPSEADANGSAIVNDVGRIGNPEWTFQSTVGAAFGNWDLVLQSRYWSDTEFAEGLPNPVITDENGMCLSGCAVGADPNVVFEEDGFTDYGFFQSSQIPLSVGATRPVTAAEGQWHHDLGLTYNWETAALTVGVNNLTDEEPPLISQEAGPNRNNAVASARYDLIGTSYFVNFVKSF
ncbi:MAG: TonB-dependent receptor domain-containing protein [Woeseiaceae bacterium]